MNYLAAIKGGSSIYLTLRPHNYDIYAQIQWISINIVTGGREFPSVCTKSNQSQQTPLLAQANQDPDFVVFHGLDREIRILHNIIHFVAFKKPYDRRKLKEYKQKNNLYHLYTILGSNSPWYSETHSYIVPNLWRLLFIQPNNDKNNNSRANAPYINTHA